MNEVSELLSGLLEPGVRIAFCDESETPGSPGPDLVADLRVLCAVTVMSDVYAQSRIDIETSLSTHFPGIAEFHATEIVNPPKDTAWAAISLGLRINAFDFLSKSLVEVSERLYFCFVSREQYAGIRARAEKLGSVNARYKVGLKRVFLRRLLERLETMGDCTAIVLDPDTSIDKPRIKPYAEATWLHSGGLVEAPSHIVPGLQLADFAAYTLTRYRRKRDSLAAGQANEFDEIVMSTLAQLEGRVVHLLGED